MPKPKVYITRQLFPEAIKIIEKVAQVDIFEGEDDPVPRDLLLNKVEKIDGLTPDADRQNKRRANGSG